MSNLDTTSRTIDGFTTEELAQFADEQTIKQECDEAATIEQEMIEQETIEQDRDEECSQSYEEWSREMSLERLREYHCMLNQIF